MMRIQKWIAQLGKGSRREAESWIKEGRIALNGKVVTELGTKLNPETDTLSLDGKLLTGEPPSKVYWLFHKPAKYLSSRKSEPDKPTVFELPCFSSLKFRVETVGRLDYMTEGLLFVTNDGDMAYRLTHPQFHVPRVYHVYISERLKPDQERGLAKGQFTLDGKPVLGLKCKFEQGETRRGVKGYWYTVTVGEGRNRLVRRIFEAHGVKVKQLVRYQFGDIKLDMDLPPGQYRQLKSAEIRYLKNLVGMDL